jgi:hypothetical protein
VTDILLRDILINARQEAARMQHHFIGVEHIFAGALSLRGGIASSLVEQYGFTPDFVTDAIRRHAGKGSKQRLWAGMPNTPRADVILSIATDLALEDNRKEMNERDILIAILEENDNIPTRMLRRLGVDLERFAQDIRTFTPLDSVTHSYVRIEFAPTYSADFTLSDEHLFVLRRMFYGYSRVRIERRLTGGFSRALLLAATPIHADGNEDSPVVVKIDAVDDILEEAQRYEQHVKSTLPPLTARLEERPTAPETSELAGLKYTLVAGLNKTLYDMRTAAPLLGPTRMAIWLKGELYTYFGRAWWEQRRPFRFNVWEEYDFLLPPLLVLEYLSEDQSIPQDAHVVRDPVRRERIQDIDYGDAVMVSGFTVQRVSREKGTLTLSIGSGSEAARRAHRIEMRGIDLAQHTHYRGEVIEQIVGRLFSTRDEILFNAVRALDPDFDSIDALIPITRAEDKAPNPLLKYNDLLERQISGTVCRIHGDLHLGNLLLGPGDSAFLIDFANARSGHTLFDWAVLEISLLNETIMKTIGESWDDARRIIEHIGTLDGGVAAPDPQLDDAFAPLQSLREIVAANLADPEQWTEYWVALALVALRAITWDTLDVGGRRLMFLLAAYCCGRLVVRPTAGAGDTYSGGGDTDYADRSTWRSSASPPQEPDP